MKQVSLVAAWVMCALLCPGVSGQPNEPVTKSPLAGTEGGRRNFEALFAPDGGRLVSVEVNVGPKYGGIVVKGFRFIREAADGKRVETVVGPADGEYRKPVEVRKGVQVVGISGRHGLVIDSIRFHFSDGTTSPPLGGSGGSQEFRLILRGQDGKYSGRVTGLYGLAAGDAVTGVGLLLLGAGGRPAALDLPETLALTIEGEVDAELAPVVGKMTALYYECYPALLKRFDNPAKPAPRHITLIFKSRMQAPAYWDGRAISVSTRWLKDHPDDIALLTHELTHAVQAYTGNPPGWLVEGIADYARHLYGPKAQPGWKLPESFRARQSYKDSYRTAARFLLWLDEQHPGLVDRVHRRLQTREFSPGDFKIATGKTVDELWAECVASLDKGTPEGVKSDR